MTAKPLARLFFCALLATFAVSAQAQTYTVLTTFEADDGAMNNPGTRQIVEGRNGDVYAGSVGQGALFSESTAGVLAQVANNGGPQGVTLGSDGNLYTTLYFDRIGCGEVWKVTPTGTSTQIASICGTYGNGPTSAPIQAPSGVFYGTSSEMPSGGAGTIYTMTTAGTLGLLHQFVGTDGNTPIAQLTVGSDGNLYGGTRSGGANSDGVLFKVTPAGAFTVLHSFAGSDGDDVENALTLGRDGNLYGTTVSGGTNNVGTFFKLTNSGTFTVLYNFNATTYTKPNSSLVQGTDGNFYGLLEQGNSSQPGWIYSLTPSGTFTALYQFCQQTNCTDGIAPSTPLVQHTDGKFYGFTVHGGDQTVCSGDGCGVFFSFDMGVAPFVTLETTSGKVGSQVGILGQGFTKSSVVKFNGAQVTKASLSGTTFITATVPAGATDGFVTVTTGSTTLTSSQKYTVHNTWSSGAPMPTGTVQSAAAVLAGEIYVVGGYNTSGTVLANLQVYNPTTNAWSAGTPLPTATGASSAAVVNNILYVFGGSTSTAVTGTVWAYSPKTKTWTSMAPMPTPRNGTLAVVEKNVVYVMGGNLGGGANFVATVESYNPATNSWTEETSMDGAKDYAGGGLIGTTIVVADGAVNSGVITGDTEGYTATTNEWSELTADPTIRTGVCAGVIGSALYDATGYVNNAGAATTANEAYSLSTNKWTTTLAPIPQGVMWPTPAVDNGQLYCFGGWATLNGTAINNVQIYQP